ncbi:hypothetical protein J2S50_006514 [Streptomyces sp. DSM 40167]|nr:hypothetical protein [Streptomyces sp. DSM 40167]
MIRFEDVTKRCPDGTTAVDGLSLEVAEGELVTLVGPWACGKTTTMTMVNRLIEPTSGRILVDGEDVASVDPVRLRRRIGYVIQQVGLFPHRTVPDNTATVPALVGWNRAKAARERAAELLDLVGLDPAQFGPRYPDDRGHGRHGPGRPAAAARQHRERQGDDERDEHRGGGRLQLLAHGVEDDLTAGAQILPADPLVARETVVRRCGHLPIASVPHGGGRVVVARTGAGHRAVVSLSTPPDTGSAPSVARPAAP